MSRNSKVWLSGFFSSFLTFGLTIAALAATPDEALNSFQSVYNQELKDVEATPALTDDVELAVELLKSAQKITNQPALFTVFCEKVYELAAKDSTGYVTAIVAMELLTEKVPDKKVECLQKCVDIIQNEYRRARGKTKTKAGQLLIQALTELTDAQTSAENIEEAITTMRQAVNIAKSIRPTTASSLQVQLTALFKRRPTEKQISEFKDKLLANPDAPDALKKLVQLFLVELDEPAKALKFINKSLDRTTRKYVSGAVKPINEAPELACLELAKWYAGLANQTRTTSSKSAMFWRAKDYYERFLDIHSEQNLSRTTAMLALNKIERALTKLGTAGQRADKPGSWIDCLKLVRLPKDAARGKWKRQGNQLFVMKESRSCLATIPISPQGNYQLQIVFIRTEGNQLGVLLPVGSTACGVVLDGFGGWGHAIEKVYASEKEGFRGGKWVHPGKLINNQEYCLDIRVKLHNKQVEINVILDGKKNNQWQGPIAPLHPPGWSVPDIKFLTLHAWSSAIQFRSVRFRKLPEEAKRLSEGLQELSLKQTSNFF